MMIEISFAYFLSHCEDIRNYSKDFGCIYQGVYFGNDMKITSFQIRRGDAVVTQGTIRKQFQFRKYFSEFLSFVSKDEAIFERICNYETEQQFEIMSDADYVKLLESYPKTIIKNEKEIVVTKEAFQNAYRNMDFDTPHGLYHMSTHTNICTQMKYCCSIIPEEEREAWYFAVEPISLYESAASESYFKRCKDVKQYTDIELYDLYAKERKEQLHQAEETPDILTRSATVVELARRRAADTCDLADKNGNYHQAPVFGDFGPYLEPHHIDWLSRGGQDILENVVALCPNCHRRMHILNDPKDVERLKKRAASYWIP